MVNKINSKFPEFKNSKFYDKEHQNIPYVFIGDFGDFVKEELEKGNSVLAKKVIAFINSTYEELDDEGKNLIWVGIFEVVSSNKEWHSLLLKNLIEPVRTQYFRRFEKHQISEIFD
jgi:hypothetical protein